MRKKSESTIIERVLECVPWKAYAKGYRRSGKTIIARAQIIYQRSMGQILGGTLRALVGKAGTCDPLPGAIHSQGGNHKPADN